MSRTRGAALGLAALAVLSTAGCASPAPGRGSLITDGGAYRFQSTHRGETRVLVRSYSETGSTQQVTDRITAVTEDGSDTQVTVTASTPGTTQTSASVFVVRADGRVVLPASTATDRSGNTYRYPAVTLPSPAQVLARTVYTQRTTAGSRVGGRTSSVPVVVTAQGLASRRITVPAGRYTTLPVQVTEQIPFAGQPETVVETVYLSERDGAVRIDVRSITAGRTVTTTDRLRSISR